MACLSVSLVGVAALTQGCAVKCHDETDPDTGKTVQVCEAENLVRYEGSARTETLSYTQGFDIVVQGANGKIDMVRGGAADEVKVTFLPHTMRGNDSAEEEAAKQDMTNDLVLSATNDGQILIKVSRAAGANATLGADMTITLPDSFTGGVNVDVGNGFLDADLGGGTPAFTTVFNGESGDVNVVGAAGKLDVTGQFDVSVKVAAWSDQDGQIRSVGSLGEVTVTVPLGANGSIQATCSDGVVTGPSSPPADWTEQTAAENSKTYSFGDVSGANVIVSGAKAVNILAG